jgi:hypothetical protein
VYDANDGPITQAFADGVKFKLAADPAKSQFAFMNERLYFVPWGERRYLVPESQMLELVNDYNCGGYAREGMFGIPRWTDSAEDTFHDPGEASYPGRPQLPEKFARLIIEKPLRLKVTKVTIDPPQKRQGKQHSAFDQSGVVELDAGRSRGMFVGMKIDADDMHGRWGSIRITTVGEAKSAGRFDVNWSGTTRSPLAVGEEFVLPGATPDAPAEPPTTPGE